MPVGAGRVSRFRPMATRATEIVGDRPRIESIDVVRGLVMILMALDHTRDFFGTAGDDPTDLSRASSALFLTRWITHFCAPVFFLLTGLSARLTLERKTRPGLSRYLFTRGLWLIVLEATLLRWVGYQWNADYHVTMLLVLWALGWSMIALAGLLWLPRPVLLIVGLVLVFGHNLADGVTSTHPLWVLLHRPGFLLSTPNHVVFVAYPLIPWIGVTALGFALGDTYRWDAERRQTWLRRLGVAACVSFVVLRLFNSYGDPRPWDSARTILSFLNTTKYPPSLAFLLMTLGPALLVLNLLDRRTPSALRYALTLGRVPFFYYVFHFFLIHLLAALVCLAQTGTLAPMFESPDLAHYPVSFPPGWGFGRPIVYGVWLMVVAISYAPCRWFAQIKGRSNARFLSYL